MQNGRAWIVAVDVCECLGSKVDGQYRFYQNRYRRLALDELSSCSVRPASVSTTSRVKLISESGLYRLVMRSNKPEAKAFQE